MQERKGRILFYYHHFGGLGHGTRIAAICRALNEIGHSDIVVINSGKKQPELEIYKYARVIDLPHFESEHGLFSGLKADEDLTIRFQRRKEILEKIRQSFRPDVFVCEHFPFGREALAEEIRSFIGSLKSDGCRIYSSVRDIIEQPVDVKVLNGQLNLFDGILVHSDKDMGFVTSFEQSQQLKDKLFFTGRVISRQHNELEDRKVVRQRMAVSDRAWIVVSVGGGIDGAKVINRLLKIKASLDQKITNSFLISTGPSMDAQTLNVWKSKLEGKDDIAMTAFDPDLVHYVNAADLSISMGGYNSLNNALLTGTPTLIFPRETDREQRKRAQHFNKFVELIDDKISDEELVEKILSLVNKPKRPYPREMIGAKKTARLLDVACDINSLKIRLDTECNLFCEMCSWKKQTIALPAGYFERIVMRARMVGVRMISLTGGEPTMLADIQDKLKFVKDNGLRLSLSTNGYLEAARLKELIPYIDDVDISIDSSDPDLHDRIRGKVGAFAKSMESIRILAKAGLPAHINVTVRPDNFIGLQNMVSLFAGLSRSMSFTLVDTTMIKNRTDRYLFSNEQLIGFYFDELLSILKECIRYKMEIRISPFFDDLKSRNPRYILTRFLSAREDYYNRFREVFHPNNKKCSIPRNFLRVNPRGDLVFCCFQDDSGVSWGNVFKDDLCDIVVSDGYFQFTNNAVEGKDPCWMCKKTYQANYGEEAQCVKSA